MEPDPILKEIRQTRDDLARETGYDRNQLFDCVRKRERESAARGVKFVSLAKAEDQEPAAGMREERKCRRGKTATGRATVVLLKMNVPDRRRLRG